MFHLFVQHALEYAKNKNSSGGYTTFRIFDPKERMISAAPFRDRVVHHALCNVIESIFEPALINNTYANRKGKGVHSGIRKCQEYVRRYPYVLKADIKKYFPSIDHAILKQVIARKIGCRATLELINTIIDYSNPQESVLDYFVGDDLFSPTARRKGLPMGNLTSQFFANLRRFYQRTGSRLKDYFGGQLSPDKMESQLNAWLGHAKQADTWHLRSKIFRWLYFECNVN